MKYYLATDLPEIIEKFFTNRAYCFFKKDGKYLTGWTYEELKGKYFAEIEASENEFGEPELDVHLTNVIPTGDELDTLEYGIDFINVVDMVCIEHFRVDRKDKKITIK